MLYFWSITVVLFEVHCSASILGRLLPFYFKFITVGFIALALFQSTAVVFYVVHCCGSKYAPSLWFNFWSTAVVHCCNFISGPMSCLLLVFYFWPTDMVLFKSIYAVLYPVHWCISITCTLLWFYLYSIAVVLFLVHCCHSVSGPLVVDHYCGSISGPLLWFYI